MKRILFILPLLISTVAVFSKNEVTFDNTFDQKIEQLFFKKDVSNASVALIDSLAEEKKLKYIKPDGYNIYFTGGEGGGKGFYTHLDEILVGLKTKSLGWLSGEDLPEARKNR